MAIIPVNPDDVENFTIVTTPRRHYASSSYGVTGSIKVYPRRSGIEKDTQKTFAFNDNTGLAAVDVAFDQAADKLIKTARSDRAKKKSIFSSAKSYIKLVESTSQKATDVLDVERFTPTTRFTKYTLIKNNVKEVLMPHYRVDYPHAHWAYTNYHSLNFFATDNIPSSSVLLYPNFVDDELPGQVGYVSGTYCLTGAFTFEFFVNPRYNKDNIDPGHFKAGTLFHLSSSYALSMITGSRKDINGLPEGFRLQLQLSQSADIPPSLAMPGLYPNNLVFVSDDNALLHNNWHHVAIRWGTNLVNDGTGSFIVDGVNRGNFVFPSGTIMPKSRMSTLNPDVLCVGNYYEGRNQGADALNLFFGARPSRRDGINQLSVEDTQDQPNNFWFRHPFKGEVHDIAFYRYYMSDSEIASRTSGLGSNAFDKSKVAFYLPPFFVEDSPVRRWVGDQGGIPQTPFFPIDGTTDDPFNVAMSFGVNAHYINLENFVKDFSTGRFPRLLFLTASMIEHTTDAVEANSLVYSQGAAVKRNLSILPCDDGEFDPNYSILKNERLRNKFMDPNGAENYSYINLDDLVTTASLKMGGAIVDAPDDYVTQLYGPNPENPGLLPGSAYKTYIAAVNSALSASAQDYEFDRGVQKGVPLTIYQRTMDPSSNQVTFFNISNLYYGRKILPKSFEIRDVSLSGSSGMIGITLRDDGMGNLYRADSFTAHATQNSVGNIFYDEGIVVVKSPHLHFFGKNQYELSFKGVQNIYSTKYEILAGPGMLNSSSNPTYLANKDKIAASGEPTDKSPFIYISGMYLHDENMNVVGKVKLAQPILKREEDKILFKFAIDN